MPKISMINVHTLLDLALDHVGHVDQAQDRERIIAKLGSFSVNRTPWACLWNSLPR